MPFLVELFMHANKRKSKYFIKIRCDLLVSRWYRFGINENVHDLMLENTSSKYGFFICLCCDCRTSLQDKGRRAHD